MAAAKEIGAEGVTHDDDVTKVSVVGMGMRTHTGVATRCSRPWPPPASTCR